MRRESIVYCVLILATLAVYWQVGTHDFVNYDDHNYLVENPYVQAGLTRASFVWAFTTTHASNWHPLTWLSHMLDCQLHGLNPGGHHFVNLLIHLASSLCLFLVFRRMTGAIWRSGFVAALFALHPLHVESVAWVAERKDVLSTLFWMLTMLAYVRYVERPNVPRYLLIVLAFSFGLMAKPMLVTLPCVLLLLDYWPLGRLLAPAASHKHAPYQGSWLQNSPALRSVLEKAPLFFAAVIVSLTTLYAQHSGGALGSFQIYPLKTRVANAFISYVIYIAKTIWPKHLAVFYPHPGAGLNMWHALGACLFLIAVSTLIMRAARRQPYLPVGWLWYLGTLVPVIGIVQVGTQAMADRYTYVPLVGLFLMAAWGVPELLAPWRHRRIALSIATGALLASLMVCTWAQLHHWRNSFNLWTHALEVTDNNYLAHENLGIVLSEQGRFNEAVSHYSAALRIKPHYASIHNNLAVALAQQGRFNEAIGHYSEALKFKPDTAEAHNNLAVALVAVGKTHDAIEHYLRALQLNPGYVEAHNNLGNALAEQGDLEEATVYFSKALEMRPSYAKAHNNLGAILARQGKIHEAVSHFDEALRLQPDFVQARVNLEVALKEVATHEQQPSLISEP